MKCCVQLVYKIKIQIPNFRSSKIEIKHLKKTTKLLNLQDKNRFGYSVPIFS